MCRKLSFIASVCGESPQIALSSPERRRCAASRSRGAMGGRLSSSRPPPVPPGAIAITVEEGDGACCGPGREFDAHLPKPSFVPVSAEQWGQLCRDLHRLVQSYKREGSVSGMTAFVFVVLLSGIAVAAPMSQALGKFAMRYGPGPGPGTVTIQDQTTVSCSRPSGWCVHQGSIYSVEDCDGDGIADHVCKDDQGQSGFLKSSDECANIWPNGICSQDRVSLAESLMPVIWLNVLFLAAIICVFVVLAKFSRPRAAVNQTVDEQIRAALADATTAAGGNVTFSYASQTCSTSSLVDFACGNCHNYRAIYVAPHDPTALRKAAATSFRSC